MTEFEADDALASAVAKWSNTSELEQIVICSPDKDLAQMVTGQDVVCWDRRRGLILDEIGVEEKFGVFPESEFDSWKVLLRGKSIFIDRHRWRYLCFYI